MDWTLVVLVAPVAILMLVGVFEAGGWYALHKHMLTHGHGVKSEVATVTIVPAVVRSRSAISKFFIGAFAMTDVFQGSTFLYNVVCKNSQGKVVQPQGTPTVTVSPSSLGSASVTSFTAAEDQVGAGTLVASADGVDSAPFDVNVVVNDKVAAVEIVPQA